MDWFIQRHGNKGQKFVHDVPDSGDPYVWLKRLYMALSGSDPVVSKEPKQRKDTHAYRMHVYLTANVIVQK